MIRPDAPLAKTIQIITTEVPPLYCILHLPSTTVMNFITWNKAYSLYPWTTFVLRTGVVTARVGESESRCLEKYHERGWPYVPGVDESPKNPVRDERCVRHIQLGRSSRHVRCCEAGNPRLRHRALELAAPRPQPHIHAMA